ncbi:MAG: CATRA conflict system CASPASE/TPR repeat-associated protein [Pseudonocardia sp.]
MARYLLHAAKARYELRVWEAGQGFRALRGETDEAVGSLLRLVDDTAGTGRDPDRSELMAAAARLVRLQARELGLVDRATRLREMRRTVAIAASNMTAHAGQDQSGGLFAEDRELVGWFDRQLDHDATYLEAALERARAVTALSDQLIQRGLQRRQERFNLGLSGVVGAVLMVLAAIQSLGYGGIAPGVTWAWGGLGAAVGLVVAVTITALGRVRSSG